MNTPSKHVYSILLCLFLVYLSWGSCFIFIRFALESFPAFILCGVRMTSAGLLLLLLTRIRGEKTIPTWKDWKHSNVMGFFLVFISSGFLAKGQESLSSGSAAMLLGSVPIWMVLSDWLTGRAERPSLVQFVGLGGGFVGLVLLGISQGTQGSDSLFGVFLILLAVFGWVYGSLQSKSYAETTSLSVMSSTALVMFLGGLQSFLAAGVLGEFSAFRLADITLKAGLSMLTLIIFGAIIAYTCYFWLLLHTRTVVAISYEYVNPVIGVFLGWLLADERVDSLMITACCLTVGSVFLIISKHKG